MEASGEGGDNTLDGHTNLNMLELKHISPDERASDLLIRPSDEQLIVVVGLIIRGTIKTSH